MLLVGAKDGSSVWMQASTDREIRELKWSGSMLDKLALHDDDDDDDDDDADDDDDDDEHDDDDDDDD
eukprot:566217-Amphidinium_carterae.1